MILFGLNHPYFFLVMSASVASLAAAIPASASARAVSKRPSALVTAKPVARLSIATKRAAGFSGLAAAPSTRVNERANRLNVSAAARCVSAR